MKLPEFNAMNDHAIRQTEGKKPLYGPIYSLSQVELEILKIYIETHLRTGFIHLFKSSARAFILYDQKSDTSFCLYVNYQGLNNLTLKNRYPFFLIGKSLDELGWVKRFTYLDLTSAYH